MGEEIPSPRPTHLDGNVGTNARGGSPSLGGHGLHEAVGSPGNEPR